MESKWVPLITNYNRFMPKYAKTITFDNEAKLHEGPLDLVISEYGRSISNVLAALNLLN